MSNNRSSFSVITSSLSHGVKKLYSKNNVISLFTPGGLWDDMVNDGLRAEECVEKVSYGHRDDKKHDTWHKNKNDFEQPHFHFLKSNNERMTPDELSCLLENVRKYDKGRKHFFNKYNVTQINTPKECFVIDLKNEMLTLEDKNKIIQSYKEFYDAKNPDEKAAAEINSKLNDVNNSLQLCFENGIRILLLSFFKTLLQNYIKLYLMDCFPENEAISWYCNIVESLSNKIVGNSLSNCLLDYVVKNILGSALESMGMDSKIVGNFLTKISSVLAVIKNPLELQQFLIAGSMAHAGASLAYQVIHLLPKLREEPPVTPMAHSPITEASEEYITLRRRKI